MMRPSDLYWCAGGLVFPELGVLIRRTSPGEELVEVFTRASTESYTDPTGATRQAGTDVLPIDWLDRNGDGVPETPSALLHASAKCWAPYPYRPQARTGYIRFIEAGSITTAGGTLLYVGNEAQTGARFVLDSDGSNYRLTYNDGSSTRSSTVSDVVPQVGDDVELYWTQAADGSLRLQQSINRGPLVRGAASTALALASAWSDERRYLNSPGGGAGVLTRLLVDKEARGIQSFSDMRAAA